MVAHKQEFGHTFFADTQEDRLKPDLAVKRIPASAEKTHTPCRKFRWKIRRLQIDGGDSLLFARDQSPFESRDAAFAYL